jgi:hypothetical protein
MKLKENKLPKLPGIAPPKTPANDLLEILKDDAYRTVLQWGQTIVEDTYAFDMSTRTELWNVYCLHGFGTERVQIDAANRT